MPSLRGGDDHLEHFLHDQRRQPLRRLVQQQQLRVQQQRARDRQHLLLAAGKLPALVALAFGQARKQLVDALDGPRAGALDRHLEVFVDRQVGEDAPPFRHEADAQRGDAVRRRMRGLGAEDADAAFARRRQADRCCAASSILPAPLRPEQRHQFARLDRQARRRSGCGSCRRRCGCRPLRARSCGFPQIGCLHSFAGGDLAPACPRPAPRLRPAP